MKYKEIIIKVCNDKVFLNPQLSIPIQKTNFPFKNLHIWRERVIYWKVEQHDYDHYEKCLIVHVIDYDANDISMFEYQNPKKEVARIDFGKVDWGKLKYILTYFNKIKPNDNLFHFELNPFPKNSITRYSHSPNNTESDLEFIFKEFRLPIYSTTIKENSWVSIHDTHFMLGYVTFKMEIKLFSKKLDFKIQNEHLLPEFDYVKYWFVKRLKTDRFNVKLAIVFTDNQISDIIATSKLIDSITPELIENVKYQRTLALTTEPIIPSSEKTLFTTEDIFDQFAINDPEGNAFKQSEKDILNFFIGEKEVRNKKQLEYLSSNLQSENHKLRFTLNPNFGFLFLVEGLEQNHFVWELQNSHATYIWSLDKSNSEIEMQYNSVEISVNIIRSIGRKAYKKNHLDYQDNKDLIFRFIDHKDIESNLIVGFQKWKIKLNELLI